MRRGCHREEVRGFREPIGVPGEARLAGVMDVTIHAFHRASPEDREKKIHGPLRRVLTDATQGDTLELLVLVCTNLNTALETLG